MRTNNWATIDNRWANWGVLFYYFKIMKPKKDGRSLDDDMEFYDDEDYVNEDEPEIIEDADPEFEEDEEDQKDGE